jgi:transketolase
MNAIAAALPGFVGGSADLAGSNRTTLKGLGDLGFGDNQGRNIHFGVREHAMAAMVNGMALHGGLIPSARHSSTSPTTCGLLCVLRP